MTKIKKTNEWAKKYGARPLLLLSLSAIILFFLNVYVKRLRMHQSDDYTHYKIGCEIYDLNFDLIRKFSGYDCLFLSNGSYVAINDNNIAAYSNTNRPLWKRELETHHHAVISPNEKMIYFLGNAYHDWRGLRVRFDTLLALDSKNGSTIAVWDAFDRVEELERESQWKYHKEQQINSWGMHKDRAPYEFMHFNSIDFVPPNDLEEKFSELTSGNLIVSAGVSLVLFFSPGLELMKILNVDKTQGTNFHDTQITPEGELLIYRNMSNDYPSTQLQLLSYPELKKKWVFPTAKDKLQFHSFACGSLQIIEDDNVLFSENSSGGRFYEITRDGEIKKNQITKDIDPNTGRPKDIFKIKKMDLSQFMKNNFYQGP